MWSTCYVPKGDRESTYLQGFAAMISPELRTDNAKFDDLARQAIAIEVDRSWNAG